MAESIRQVVSQPEYSWRMPRHEEVKTVRFLESVAETIDDFVSWLLDKLTPEDRRTSRRTSSNGEWNWGFANIANLLLWCLLIVLGLAILAVLAFIVTTKRTKSKATNVTPTPVVTDLNAEDISAEQMPERGWMKLAQQMMDAGDRRLAMRAMYLGCLALLAEQRFLTIVRSKSNYEYARELGARRHDQPELTSSFTQNVGFFEDSWYGLHEVNDQTFEMFLSNHQRIRTCAEA